MPVTIPPARKYPGLLKMVPDPWAKAPPEGPQQIPIEVNWDDIPVSVTGSNSKAVVFPLYGAGGSTQQFSRCAALSIDNSACGADVQFVFPDVSDTLTIPAYSPKVIVPCFSNAQDFYLLNVGELISGDKTRFSMHNSMPPPLAVPISELQNVAASAGIVVDGTSNNVVLAAGNGTLDSLQISFSNTILGASAYLASFRVRDGANRTLGLAQLSGDSSTDILENGLIFNMTGMNLRFSGGISMQQTLITGAITAGQSYVSVNALYRTP